MAGDVVSIEQILVSERLDHIDGRLESLEHQAISSNEKLARLVELAEIRDRREQSEHELRIARGKWLASVVRMDLIIPYLIAAITGAGIAGVSSGQIADVVQEISQPTDAP